MTRQTRFPKRGSSTRSTSRRAGVKTLPTHLPAKQRLALAATLGAALLTMCMLFTLLPRTSAAVSIPTATPAIQNFDGMGTAATATLPTDFRLDRPSAVRTVGTYAAASTATTQVGGANLSTTATNGAYNFGSGTTSTGGADRAVGFLSSGTATQSGNLYVQLVNNTGGGLASLDIAYDVEKYRNGINPAGFRIQLFYSADGSTWTNAGASFLTSFAADTGTNSGFATAPGATVPVSATLNVAIPNNANFYLAWNYSVSSGSTTTNAQALAIDNVSIKGTPAVAQNNPPTITAPANPITTVTQDSAPFNVSLTGSDDGGVYNWSATPGAGVSSVNVTGGQGTSNATFTVTLQNGYSGTASFNALLSDNVNAPVSQAVNINVTSAPPNHVVISQVYGGGGNSNATYANDYVELYNPTSTTFTLTGWSLQYASATGTSWTNKQPLGGTLSPGNYYLVALASGGAVGQPLPAANIVGNINMSATTGKIALVSNGDPLSGGCPVGSDPDIVDFVGYGTTASCHEGSANAPAPSNTTALFRLNGGNSDTNQNGNDFVTGAPNPRRTEPIVELGPWVSDTDPLSGATTVPHDASMTINFSEPVDVVGPWYTITCTVTGPHNDATVAHTSDFKSYVITPNTNFQFGEQCTVTVLKDGVHDQDTDDSGPNTDTLFADYSWSFNVVAAGQPAPYPPSVHLTMGNPSNAMADVMQPNNYLMEKPTYALSYNRDKGTPNWVSWHLDSSWYGVLTRVDTFRPDPAVPPDWYRVQAFDFFTTGFDRGHMTPNADRDNENRIPINQETYLMSNMVPQAPDNNQGPWANLESYLRTLTDAGNEIYIVSGPAGVGGVGSNGGLTTTLADGHVTVPAYTWKVALVLPKGDNDLSRVTAATRTIAVIMPNTQGIRTNDPNDWQNFLTTVDAVEQLTGYDFFSNLPVAVQNSIEAGTNGSNPPGTADQAATTNEDTPTSIALSGVSPDANPTFTYTVGQPSHGTLTGTGANRTYTPDSNFNGTDSFTFSVNDGHANSNTSTVTITVSPVNDAPSANGQSVTTDSNVAASITLTGSDLETPAASLTYTVASGPAHGTLSGTAPNLTYTPAANYCGSDSFTFTVTDGGDGSSAALTSGAATVSITVNDTVPPTITLNGNSVITVECHTSFTDPGATANDSCSGTVTATASGAVDVNTPGTYTITYSASDPAGNAATPATRTVKVVDTTAPVITLNGASTITVECHAGFTDPGATASDACAGSLPVTASGAVNVNAPGSYVITYTATDPSGNLTAAMRIVKVVDTTPPTITLTGQQIELWPANHQYVTINVSQLVASAGDNCAGDLTANVVIARVTSDEPENSGGDGNTLDDIVINPGCQSVQLRAEREGGGNGRVYTITFKVTDAAGNVTTASAKVTVPKSQGKNGAAVDDGPVYTVNGSCP